MERGESWYDFWSICAESTNEELRSNFLSGNELCDFYKNELIKMENLMKKTKTRKNIELYRNVCFDSYSEFTEGDRFSEGTFLSCFVDGFDSKYGNVCLKIQIPEGTSHLRHENVVVVPPGIYEIIDINMNFYVIRLIYEKTILKYL